MIVEFETEERVVVVDTEEDLGELTPSEFLLIAEYTNRSGFLPDDPERARAGGALLVLLSRKISMSRRELLDRVLADA